jgi:hypothetical protein
VKHGKRNEASGIRQVEYEKRNTASAIGHRQAELTGGIGCLMHHISKCARETSLLL